jgi:hypothetical protein
MTAPVVGSRTTVFGVLDIKNVSWVYEKPVLGRLALAMVGASNPSPIPALARVTTSVRLRSMRFLPCL